MCNRDTKEETKDQAEEIVITLPKRKRVPRKANPKGASKAQKKDSIAAPSSKFMSSRCTCISMTKCFWCILGSDEFVDVDDDNNNCFTDWNDESPEGFTGYTSSTSIHSGAWPSEATLKTQGIKSNTQLGVSLSKPSLHMDINTAGNIVHDPRVYFMHLTLLLPRNFSNIYNLWWVC